MGLTAEFRLDEDGFRGYFYKGEKKPGKAVIYVGGSGTSEMMTKNSAGFLIDEGYSVMVLGFYLWEGLPKKLRHIPLEYAERAADWLRQQGYTDICRAGISTGAVYTLLCASKFPQITRVAAVSPFDHVMEGVQILGARTASSVYCYRGEDLPYSRFSVIDGGWARALKTAADEGALRLFMRYGYERAELTEESRIKAEDINGDILMIYPAHDECWPSDEAVPRIVQQLREHGFGHRVRAVRYNRASHALGSWPVDEMGVRIFLRAYCPNERKYRRECGAARKKSINEILRFLEEWE